MIRIHAAKTIARRKIFETFINPGYYLTLSAGLMIGFFLIKAFINSIDSSGFNIHLNPFFDLIGRSLEGAFGKTFIEKLYSEGVFLFILYISFIPVHLYLAIGSVFRIGLEKKVGAIELLTYGPADDTAYILASIIKDILFTALTLIVILLFCSVAAIINNLVLGPMFINSLISIFFISIAIYSFGILSTTLTENSAAAVSMFMVIILFFLVIMIGSFTIVDQNITILISLVFKWLSPFFYWELGIQAFQTSTTGIYILSLVLLTILMIVVLFFSHIILNIKRERL